MSTLNPNAIGLTFHDRNWLPAVAAAAMLAVTPVVGPVLAQQGTDSQQAIDAIIGTEVQEEEAKAANDAQRLIAAIDKTVENTATVRKTSNLTKVDIVFLPDAARTEGGPPPEVEAKVKEREKEIAELRKEIEGNAMLFHAIDSRQILPQDVLAVEFDDANGVVIFAAARKPAG
ncbi:MAG: hypothetical protein M3Y43_09675 [Pseudomonadota bacterium]|nr:hypothetical protein [Pseudomonadota bacterium]MDQ2705424.1 hypothetical protein [Pseudomonadota bacterium]